jgi:hypothetical protein
MPRPTPPRPCLFWVQPTLNSSVPSSNPVTQSFLPFRWISNALMNSMVAPMGQFVPTTGHDRTVPRVMSHVAFPRPTPTPTTAHALRERSATDRAVGRVGPGGAGGTAECTQHLRGAIIVSWGADSCLQCWCCCFSPQPRSELTITAWGGVVIGVWISLRPGIDRADFKATSTDSRIHRGTAGSSERG